MFVVIFALILVSVSFAQGASFLVDFNETGGTSRPVGTWNEYDAPGDIRGGKLADSGGTIPTFGGPTLSVTGDITDNTLNSGLAVYQPANNSGRNPVWAGAVGLNGATGDNFYTNNSPNSVAHTFTLSFGGLEAGSYLSLDLLASRDSTLARGYFDYSLDNGTTWSGFTVVEYDGTPTTLGGWDTKNTATQIFSLKNDGFTNHRYLTMSGTLSATSTTLMVRTTDDTSEASVFSAMNALRLTTVPEPSSAAMLILPVLGLVFRRRR
ncbi:PEP-CTERM sorting domain-containing protein [Luteolibacter sp. AS25]|uniref:PEP-CTERM sorting domain-containing protein n=1 Tax=Luteolibacter sp. AS25 TaxID=3135776 RepID=UPI00398A9715